MRDVLIVVPTKSREPAPTYAAADGGTDLSAVTHQHTVVLGLVQCGGNVQPLPDQRRSHRCGGARAVKRGQQYGSPRCCGQAGELLLVHNPKTVAHRQRVGQRRGTHSLGTGEAAGDLQDPERVAAGVVNQALNDSFRNAIWHQRKSVSAGHASEGQDGHSRHELRWDRAASRRPQKAHPVLTEATSRESECGSRLTVDPLQVVDQHQHRCPF